jgi:16S rRNA (adenine1518-N6/adenine1519-N6)-dimethyltransferase
MSLTETKQLLRTFRIVPNRLLGQNFMVEPAFYPRLCEYACLTEADVVLDVGAGFGFLTRYLADKCAAVVAVEKDSHVAAVLRERVKDCRNVSVVEGDAFKAELPVFDKVVAVPPYYLSSQLISWLLERKTKCAVLILQREFAARLEASVGSENYGWLTVLVSYEAQVSILDVVPKSAFFPQPEVDSVVVRLSRWKNAPFEVDDEVFFNKLVKWLFTQRNKKTCNSIVSFLRNTRKMNKEEAKELASKTPFKDKRGRELSPREFGELSDALKE